VRGRVARDEGVDCDAKNAPRVKCEAVEGYGGKIAFCEPTVSARKAMCAKLQAETGAVLVHPYDDDRIIAGKRRRRRSCSRRCLIWTRFGAGERRRLVERELLKRAAHAAGDSHVRMRANGGEMTRIFR